MKLHLFGASGTGVTTLGRALSVAWPCPYLDSDDYFWLPTQPAYTQRRPPAERNAQLAADLVRHPSVVVGGSLGGWGNEWFAAFDLAVFLWLPPALRPSPRSRPHAGGSHGRVSGLGRWLRRQQHRRHPHPGQPHGVADALSLPRAGAARRPDRG